MKTGELLTVIKDFFDESGKKQRTKKKYLKEVLAGLKRKQKNLEKKLAKEKNGKTQKNISREIAIICSQRKKGLKLLKDLKKA